MFSVLRMGAIEEQGACLNNTGGDSFRSGLARTSDDSAVRGPEKGCLSEAAASASRGRLISDHVGTPRDTHTTRPVFSVQP
jgi:hypothetical protein